MGGRSSSSGINNIGFNSRSSSESASQSPNAVNSTNTVASNIAGRINQYFTSAAKIPRHMNSMYARRVVEAWESNDIEYRFGPGGGSIADWVVKYNGMYDKKLVDEAVQIINTWEDVKSRRKW